MFGWIQENKSLIESIIAFDGFRLGSIVMYGLFCAAIFKIGVTSHYEKATGRENPLVYPKGYFSWLAISLIPLAFTGLARHDAFLMSTRITTLLCVLFAYAAVANESGVFNWLQIRNWIGSAFIAVMVVPVIWQDNESLRYYVATYDQILGWISVGLMFAFMFFGLRLTAKSLIEGVFKGDYKIGGFGLQIVRLFAFGLQAIHYGYVFGYADPVFIQGAMGTIGALGVVVAYLFSVIKRWTVGSRTDVATA